MLTLFGNAAGYLTPLSLSLSLLRSNEKCCVLIWHLNCYLLRIGDSKESRAGHSQASQPAVDAQDRVEASSNIPSIHPFQLFTLALSYLSLSLSFSIFSFHIFYWKKLGYPVSVGPNRQTGLLSFYTQLFQSCAIFHHFSIHFQLLTAGVLPPPNPPPPPLPSQFRQFRDWFHLLHSFETWSVRAEFWMFHTNLFWSNFSKFDRQLPTISGCSVGWLDQYLNVAELVYFTLIFRLFRWHFP